jgi:hypothetical protein
LVLSLRRPVARSLGGPKNSVTVRALAQAAREFFTDIPNKGYTAHVQTEAGAENFVLVDLRLKG